MASVSPEVVTLAPETPIAGLEAGWYAAFDRPPVRTHVALCFGEWVVAAEPIPPAEDRVVLVVEPEAIAAMQCTVVGRLDDEAPLVRVRPLSASGEPLAPVLATGSEGAFEIRAVPPGRVRLEVGVDEGVMTRALLTQTPRVTGMKSISLGSRVEDLEQWEHRLAVLSSIEAPFVRTVLELVPGERRDLGSITYAPAGAVLLALVDGAGTPMDSTGVLARAIPKAGDLPSAPVNWTFENQVLLFPLALEPVEFYLERGGLGTRVGVLPTGLIPGSTPSVQTVVMEPSPSSAPPRPDRP